MSDCHLYPPSNVHPFTKKCMNWAKIIAPIKGGRGARRPTPVAKGKAKSVKGIDGQTA